MALEMWRDQLTVGNTSCHHMHLMVSAIPVTVTCAFAGRLSEKHFCEVDVAVVSLAASLRSSSSDIHIAEHPLGL